jgi:hypothetical protein
VQRYALDTLAGYSRRWLPTPLSVATERLGKKVDRRILERIERVSEARAENGVQSRRRSE